MDKNFITNGLVWIRLIRWKLDIVIFCDPRQLQPFMHTVEAVQNIQELEGMELDEWTEGSHDVSVGE